jgi:hypothetical protein
MHKVYNVTNQSSGISSYFEETEEVRSLETPVRLFGITPQNIKLNIHHDETSNLILLRGWSENFSASTIHGNTIGKIFFKLVHVISIHVNCKSFYQAVCFIQWSQAGMLSVSLKIDKIEYRVVIKLFVNEGLMPN